jgi:plasmid stabilization system protein ParE
MALEVVLTKRADRKLDNIIKYLLKEFGTRVTRLFVKKVHIFFEQIAEYPEMGTLENELKGIRGFTLVKQINIFYIVERNQIKILDFFDNRRSPLKKRF